MSMTGLASIPGIEVDPMWSMRRATPAKRRPQGARLFAEEVRPRRIVRYDDYRVGHLVHVPEVPSFGLG